MTTAKYAKSAKSFTLPKQHQTRLTLSHKFPMVAALRFPETLGVLCVLGGSFASFD
jgi:hypothetical protein